MNMLNSSDSLLKFISNLQLASLYAEDNFPLSIPSTFRMRPADAVRSLLTSAMVGNKVAGFFHKVPPFTVDRPLRATCLFFSRELPSEIKTPVFFCQSPEQLPEIMPRAVKTSVDTGMPVQIVLSANSLNNYSTKEIPFDTQDRVLPYISASGFSEMWDPAQRREKLTTALSAARLAMPYVKPEPENGCLNVSLESPRAYFPEYLFPLASAEQAELFSGVKTIHTTPDELLFVSAWVNDLLGLPVEVKAALTAPKALTETKLCPGCPFMAIFSASDIAEHIVFSSVNCPAVKDIYPVTGADYTEYIGITSQNTGKQTLFVGTMSDLCGADGAFFKRGKVILLQDTAAKPPLPVLSNITKLKNIKSMALPHGCGNIKQGQAVKYNHKRCNCFEHKIPPICIGKSHCAALQISTRPAEKKPDMIHIAKNLCTGCRLCVQFCPVKALS